DLAVVTDGGAAVVPGLPPPLPPNEGDAAGHPVAADTTPIARAAAVLRRGPVGVAIVAGAIALALGIATGWVVGSATAPSPPAVTHP
ncbi:MAG TPA: FHA domain-containing protein, partial [Anaeromyxobacteraceae bacterium]|nr:FHA domain-containing protein [Anaeromyxobacteraceae bacterium]